MEPTSDDQDTSGLSLGGCLLRLFWMGLGNAALLYASLHLAFARDVVAANVIFFGVAAALLVARAIDVLRFGGLTTDSRPATTADLRRYSVGLVAVVAILWALAHAARSAGATIAE